jgi:hypothetical protein
VAVEKHAGASKSAVLVLRVVKPVKIKNEQIAHFNAVTCRRPCPFLMGIGLRMLKNQ